MVCDVKVVKSEHPSDCGAACMVSLLDYYDEEVTLDDMVKECHVNIYGGTLKDMAACGRAHGLEMKAWREVDADEDIDVDATVIDVDILEQDRPSIIWWKYNHFLICCGVDEKGRVVLMNPARGRYTVSESLFRAFYSKISLTNGIPEREPGEAADESN